MRIAIITNDMHPSRGGPPRVVLGHALQLKKRGLDPVVIGTFGPGEESASRTGWPELAEAGIELKLFPRVGYDSLGRSPEFNHWFTDHAASFDVMHLHGLWEAD